MADADRYAKVASTYADEMRGIADRLEELRRDLGEMGPDRQTWPMALEVADVAVLALRTKARGLDDLPALAGLWIDNDQED